MAKLKPCPVCGKMPKIKETSWYDRGAKRLIEIRCKPFFGKVHCEIQWCGTEAWVHMKDAVRCWNGRATYIENCKNT